MSSTLGSNLVDSLVPVVDALRSSLHPDMGVRQYTVTLVKRTWDGGRVGDGVATFDSETVLSPQPHVFWDSREFRLSPDAGCGLVDAGNCTLKEVSLTYTESDLLGISLNAGQEFYYRISDAHGQGIATTYWIPSATPIPDREQDIGWIVHLRRYEVDETDTEPVPGP